MMTTCELVRDVFADQNGNKPDIIARFPGKLVFSHSVNEETERILQNIYLHKNGMVYILKMHDATCAMYMISDDNYMISPCGEYTSESGFHQIKNSKCKMVWEYDASIQEEASVAELDWRINLERQMREYKKAIMQQQLAQKLAQQYTHTISSVLADLRNMYIEAQNRQTSSDNDDDNEFMPDDEFPFDTDDYGDYDGNYDGNYGDDNDDNDDENS